MSRAFDFVVISVIWVVAVIIHVMGLELFSPGTPLYEAAAGASHLNGAARAQLWYEILSVWVPLLAAGGITVWGFVREYRRQALTAVQGARRP